MNKIYERVDRCLDCVRRITDFVPETAIILGSGLGAFAESIDAKAIIPYNEISDFPVSTVPGHKGRFVLGYVDEVPVVVMQGRVHYYEGYSMEDVVLPVRLMRLMGAKSLVLTNASGGINKSFKAGDFMVMEDHISLFIKNPLIGANVEEFGTRFPDMSCVYDSEYRDAIYAAANELGVDVKRGTYVQLTGPSYESPAEIKLLGSMGADAVGMSTVCEAITARHAGMRICGISCVSNMAAGISERPLAHAEVQEAMDKAGAVFGKLLRESIIRIHKLA